MEKKLSRVEYETHLREQNVSEDEIRKIVSHMEAKGIWRQENGKPNVL